MTVPRFYHASVRDFYGGNGINPRRIMNARAAFSVNPPRWWASELKQISSVERHLFKGAVQMADDKKTSDKKPGEHAEGKYHYNPGNQAGKTVEDSEKEDNLDRVKNRAPPPHERP
jgi:hypothetical protein